MSPLKRYRRAVSPVVTTLFLFGVILGAIAVSLGIIYPALVELDDQINLETTASTLNNLDDSVQNMILSGAENEFFDDIKVGVGGVLRYDNSTNLQIEVVDGGSTTALSYGIRNYRIQVEQPVDSNWLPEGTTKYFGGAGDQSALFLNDTNRRFLGWSVIEQTRPTGSDNVNTSLFYRNVVTSSSYYSASELTQKVTIQIQMLNFTLASGSPASSSKATIPLGLSFQGSQTFTTGYVSFSNDATMKAIGSSGTSTILTALHPSDPNVNLEVRLQFVYHLVEMDIRT